eukprot:9280586-Pyramimonas_sp.AAC.1
MRRTNWDANEIASCRTHPRLRGAWSSPDGYGYCVRAARSCPSLLMAFRSCSRPSAAVLRRPRAGESCSRRSLPPLSRSS